MNCPASSLGATPTRKGKRAAFSAISDLDPSPRYRRAPRARINFFVISPERRGQGSVEGRPVASSEPPAALVLERPGDIH